MTAFNKLSGSEHFFEWEIDNFADELFFKGNLE